MRRWFRRQDTVIKVFIVGFGVPALLFACLIGFALMFPVSESDAPLNPARAYETTAAKRNATRTAEATSKKRVAPLSTRTPTPLPMGISRLHPLPMGESIVADNGIEITVLGLERDAWPTVRAANSFNSAPDEGMEYIIVEVQVRNLGDPAETSLVGTLDFRVVGERATIYDAPIMLVLDNALHVEFFGGGIAEGQLAFQVVQGENNLVLIYDSGLDTTARYLSLEIE